MMLPFYTILYGTRIPLLARYWRLDTWRDFKLAGAIKLVIIIWRLFYKQTVEQNQRCLVGLHSLLETGLDTWNGICTFLISVITFVMDMLGT